MFESMTLLKQGGWPMIALAACSLVAVTIIIERLIALRRSAVIDPRTKEAIQGLSDAASVPGVEKLCRGGVQSQADFIRLGRSGVRVRGDALGLPREGRSHGVGIGRSGIEAEQAEGIGIGGDAEDSIDGRGEGHGDAPLRCSRGVAGSATSPPRLRSIARSRDPHGSGA